MKNINEEKMTDNQFTESIKLLEYFQHTDLRSESLIHPKDLKKIPEKELIRDFWNELESWLKAYQDMSEKHKALYNHGKKIRDNLLKANEVVSAKTIPSKRPDSFDIKKEAFAMDNSNKYISFLNNLLKSF